MKLALKGCHPGLDPGSSAGTGYATHAGEDTA